MAWNENGDDRLLVAKRLDGNCHERGSDRHAFPSQILGSGDGLSADLGINCHAPNSVLFTFTSFVL